MVTPGPKRPYHPLQFFPRLNSGNCKITSPLSEDYNCLAWAVEVQDKSFWPDSDENIIHEPAIEWPKGIPNEETVEAFLAFFRLFGYESCEGPAFEDEFVKIVIFVNHSGMPTHACRQLPSRKKWTSKMGYDGVDIELDDLSSIETALYGITKVYMKRPVQG